MNHNNEDSRNALLDELLSSPGSDTGLETVLAMVRDERQRRRSQLAWSRGIAAVIVLTVAIVVGIEKAPQQDAATLVSSPAANSDTHRDSPGGDVRADHPLVITHADESTAKRFPIQEIDDEQLLSMLGTTPAALIEWPNGDRTLLMVAHQR